MNLNGKIIVIEGTDGSGKQTQTAKLKERLTKEGYEVYTNSFPNYDSNSSAAVKMYLNGEIRPNATEVSAEAASMFYAIDRYITYKREIEQVCDANDKVIVFDRWVSSNIIHQGAKILAEFPEKQLRTKKLQEFINWLYDIEHRRLGVPEAYRTIYLHVPLEYTVALREKRANKITGGEKQDIHESDDNHLKNASDSGLIAAKLLGWDIIECVQDDSMRSIEDISEEIWKRINE